MREKDRDKKKEKKSVENMKKFLRMTATNQHYFHESVKSRLSEKTALSSQSSFFRSPA
jgi:hypothetical protein